MEENKGVLYLVSTPVGNLKDITYRAVETLNEVDMILCEDTRVSINLLNHYNIKKKLVSFHKFNELQRFEYIKEQLDLNLKIALISDAGTPLISDPGIFLIPKLLTQNYKIVPIPGASAILPAVQLSGIVNNSFLFLGFLPNQKKEREEIFKKIEVLNIPSFFYESPHAIINTLNELLNYFGDINVAIAREITKHFETRYYDKISVLLNNEYKGEIVAGFNIEPKKEEFDVKKLAKPYKEAGFSSKDISKILSIQYDISKNDVYKELI